MNPNAKQPSPLSFESAFQRLEEILQKMNSSAVSLDESLKLYEEADKLISECSSKLNDAERKIEILIKNRSGEVQLSDNGEPKTEHFSPK